MNNVYSNPKYYEMAFSFRDIPAEIAVFEECIKHFSKIPVRHFLEIGCGNSPHMEELLKKGHKYTGIDLSREMLEYSRQKAAGINKKATLLCKNMVNFTIPEKVDFAYIMLGSLYIKSNAEQKSHFDSVARSLKKGGLYFLDWCVQFEPAAYRFESWQTSKRQTKIKFIYQTRMKDYAKQLFEEIITLNINDGGKKKILLQKNLRKAVYPQEFLNFLSLRGDFEFMGWWNNWNLKKPLSGTEKISRPIVIIRRT